MSKVLIVKSWEKGSQGNLPINELVQDAQSIISGVNIELALLKESLGKWPHADFILVLGRMKKGKDISLFDIARCPSLGIIIFAGGDHSAKHWISSFLSKFSVFRSVPKNKCKDKFVYILNGKEYETKDTSISSHKNRNENCENILTDLTEFGRYNNYYWEWSKYE